MAKAQPKKSQTKTKAQLELSFTGLKPSRAMQTLIRSQLRRLERLSTGMTSCHVWIDTIHRSEAKGSSKVVSFDVRVEVRLPGTEIAITRKPGGPVHKDLPTAVRHSFSAMERRLKAYVSRRRTTRTTPRPTARLRRAAGAGRE